MVTMVGTEADFLNMLGDLVSLDHDAIAAYESALSRLDNASFREQLQAFKADHERHVRELDGIIRELGGAPSSGPGAKSMLTQGKVVIASLFGDKTILMAMKTNEDDTNTAYDRAVAYQKAPAVAKDILGRGLADERRHRAWIEATIEKL